MDLFSLECFIEVVNNKSFTRAADRVRRTQSAVTQQISNLEKLLQVRLFERGKGITLTHQGEIFLQYALKMCALNKEAIERFKEPELDGEVKLGVPEDFATLFLTDVLVEFIKAHPRVSLNVECDLTLNLFEQFKQDKLDLVLVKMSSLKDFPDGVEIWSESLVWVGKANRSSLAHFSDPLPLILSPAPCVYRSAALVSLMQHDRSSKVVFSSPSYSGITAAVRADLGITVLPSTMVPEGLEPITDALLPLLPELHVSMLTSKKESAPIICLKQHILKKLLHQRNCRFLSK